MYKCPVWTGYREGTIRGSSDVLYRVAVPEEQNQEQEQQTVQKIDSRTKLRGVCLVRVYYRDTRWSTARVVVSCGVVGGYRL